MNEPETSLRPDLLAALVEPRVATAKHSQLLVLTHAHAFANAVAERTEGSRVELSRVAGATVIVGADKEEEREEESA